jgi:ABC-2 type transport system permease protein
MSAQAETPLQDPYNQHAASPAPLSKPRPFYWSVRREIWENRSIYLAPLIVAGVVLFATLVSMAGLPGRSRNTSPDSAKRYASVVQHYGMAPVPIMFVTFVVGFFYSLDALYGERRDRSILFWKSLPVSDRTAVLSKAAIPLVVLPLIAVVLGAATQWFVLLLNTAVLVGQGGSAAALWSQFHVFQEQLVMSYHLMAHALYLAPICGWLLLVSAWARRTPLLWAVLPPFAVGLVERIVFNSSYVLALMNNRIMGAMESSFTPEGQHGMPGMLSQVTPLSFMTAPGLWIGLLFTAAFLAAAMRLRRNREPI